MSGRPTNSRRLFASQRGEAVQIARGSLSNSTARMVAPMGPIPRKVTPIPCGTQTTFWYFQPVAKNTNPSLSPSAAKGSLSRNAFGFQPSRGENPIILCPLAEESARIR